ncbi:hypothetical protein F4861DRAFT_502752 [Xylaria intraflava]|nr:hypothetical protein F4861DRAFT_502752 [Xylaria intraflava]
MTETRKLGSTRLGKKLSLLTFLILYIQGPSWMYSQHTSRATSKKEADAADQVVSLAALGHIKSPWRERGHPKY